MPVTSRITNRLFRVIFFLFFQHACCRMLLFRLGHLVAFFSALYESQDELFILTPQTTGTFDRDSNPDFA